NKTNYLEAIDKQHIWHPFTQHSVWEEEPILIIDRGEGNELIDVEQKRYLDGISALWCNVHGHGEPRLLEALKNQAAKLCHNTLLGATHRPIIELTKELLEVVPAPLSRIFYSDGGSVAVEAALRMAIEWWQKQGTASAKKRTKLVSLVSGYHGDTIGSVGLGYVEGFHQHLQTLVVPSIKVAAPHVYRFYEGLSEEDALERSIADLHQLMKDQADSIAAFVIEPLVQGAAGIWVQPERYLQAVAEVCRQNDVLLICDEIATGFGKTGAMFASERCGVVPDIMTMGKGLSAGYLPIAAVAVGERVFDGFCGNIEELRTFYFGQTFSGNPLAAAVSTENLKLFAERELLKNVAEISTHLETCLASQVAELDHVDEIRQCGLMVGIELTEKPGARQPYPISALAGHRITLEARKRGVIIRPLGNVIVLMPSLVFSKAEVEQLVSVVRESICAALG
ncbi:UNVERIFIED_CONTAM: hypothetical protein GTU68_024537, partial [Idotea baltica]|nr:hypothetical protein [Idotea baltica]